MRLLEQEGSELIDDLEMVAKDVRYNAGQLQATTLDMKASKWAHLHHLSQIKDLVNEGLNPLLCKLGFQEFEGKWGGVKEGTGRAPDSVGSGSARTETTGTREALP